MAVHRTTYGRLPSGALEWPAGEGARLPRAAAGEHGARARPRHDGRLRRAELPLVAGAVFSHERLARAALRASEALAGAPLARLKGIFRTQEGFLLIEVAGGSLHEARSHHRRDSRADVIFEGAEAPAAAERFAGWLEGAALTARELGARAEEIELSLPDGRVRIVRRAELVALPGGVADVGALVPKRSGAAARLAALFDAYAVPAMGSAVLVRGGRLRERARPLSALREGVLVHSQGEAPLPREQGGPFRLLIPDGVAGAPSACANVKAVVRIVVKSA